MRRFQQVAVIDWSGAVGARQPGIAVAVCGNDDAAPELVKPGHRWSRQEVLDWIAGHAAAGTDMLIGLDLSPGLPFADEAAFFPGWSHSPLSAKDLWALVEELSDDDPHFAVGTFLKHPEASRYFRHQTHVGDRFSGGRGRLRLCETEQRALRLSPSSCFNLIGAAQVGKSSLTGMRVLHRLDGLVPIWPFDPVPAEGPAIVEIYTAIASREAGLRAGLSKIRDAASLDAALSALGAREHRRMDRYDDHSTDAIVTAAWLRLAQAREELWHPAALTPAIAATEGWTFGVP